MKGETTALSTISAPPQLRPQTCLQRSMRYSLNARGMQIRLHHAFETLIAFPSFRILVIGNVINFIDSNFYQFSFWEWPQTGVGKSSLINRAFGVNEAVSRFVRWYPERLTHDRIPTARISHTPLRARLTSGPRSHLPKTNSLFCMIVKASNQATFTISRQSANFWRNEARCPVSEIKSTLSGSFFCII